MFKSSNQKTKLFRIDEEDQFPELVSNVVTQTTDLNFKEIVSLPQTVKEFVTDSVKPGWIQFKRISGKETTVTYDNKIQTLSQYFEDTTDEDNERNDVFILNQLISNWDVRRAEYDELHGEGEYEKLYPIFDDVDDDDDDDE